MQTKVLTPRPEEEYFTAERCFILEMSNSTADEALSIAKARVKPAVTTAWHTVGDTDERERDVVGVGQHHVVDAV